MYRFLPILFVLGFAACGGGGGGGSETETPGASTQATASNTATQDVAGAKTTTAATTPTVATQPDSYTVVAGDTLGEIATRLNTTVEALVTENGLADANQIYVGQVLKIPKTGQ